MERDTVIEEVYSIKDRLSAEAGHSVEKLIRQMQSEINRSRWNYVSFDPNDVNTRVTDPASK